MMGLLIGGSLLALGVGKIPEDGAGTIALSQIAAVGDGHELVVNISKAKDLALVALPDDKLDSFLL